MKHVGIVESNALPNVGKVGRFAMANAPFVVNNSLNPWYKQREMPEPPKESFGEWYKKK
ncbi:MAG: hypothetical protein R2822_12925 [Spirosomataceae bacterium]